MNIIKKYFTLKRIVIFFGVVFAVLFFIGECSFKYMDWQYYVARDMCKNESGIYILNKELYEDMITYNLQDSKYTRKMEEFNKTEYERYEPTKYNRIYKLDYRKYYYYDSVRNEPYIVSFERSFAYKNYGIFLTGDEGRGFMVKTFEILECFNRDNTFTIKE